MVVIDDVIVFAIAAGLAALLAKIENLIRSWHYRSMKLPKDAREELSEKDWEEVAATRELITRIFGEDPVESLRQSSNKERIDRMDEFANKLAQLYGLDIQVDVTVDAVEKCGAYNWSERKAVFNILLLMVDGQNENFDYCVWESLDTIVHELRHAVQHKSISEPGFWGFTQQQRQAWADNMSNYISSATDMKAYTRQPIERDAFTFAAAVIEEVKKK